MVFLLFKKDNQIVYFQGPINTIDLLVVRIIVTVEKRVCFENPSSLRYNFFDTLQDPLFN